MPRVPTYNQPIIQEAAPSQTRVSITPSLEALGGGADGLGRAIAGAVSTAAHVYNREKQKADELAVLEAKTDLEKKHQILLYDTKSGAYTRKGKDAFDIQNEYGSQFGSHGDALEEGLNNREQKDMFRKIRMRMGSDLDNQLGRHVFQETQRYDDETTDAALLSLQNKAELSHKDPQKIAEAMTEAAAVYDSYTARKGFGEEKAKIGKQVLLSKMHSGVIGRYMANDDDVAAKNYYALAQSLGQITGDDATKLENKLKETSSRGESQRQSDLLLAKYGSDYGLAIKAAEKIEDSKIRDLTVSRIEHKASQSESMIRLAQSQAAKASEEILKETKGDINALMSSPYWDQMSLAQQKDKIEHSRQIREGVQPITDWKKYTELKLLAATPETRSKFLKIDPYSMRSQLNDSQYHEIVGLWTSLKNQDGKAEKELDDFRSIPNIMMAEIRRAGFDPTPKDTDAKGSNLVAEIYDQAARRQRAFQETTGRKMNNQEFQEMMSGLMNEKVKHERSLINPARWFGDKYYEERMVESAAKDVTINAADRKAIVDQLTRAKAAGKYNGPINESTIKAQYLYIKGKSVNGK